MAEITRELIDKALTAALDCDAQGVNAAIGAFWYEREDVPPDVREGWRQVGYLGLRDALIRWRDSLPVSKVARWDAARGAYVAHDNEGDVCMVATGRAQAIAWGYTIEGGPEVDDTAPNAEDAP